MDTPDIENLLKDIREQVRIRRIAGDYPPGLEQELEFEFRGVVDRERRDWTSIRHQLAERSNRVIEAFAQIDGITTTQSRIPGGRIYHSLTRKLFGRQTRGLADQIRGASTELVALVRLIADLQMAQEEADRRLVMHLSKSVLDRLAVVDHLAIVMREIERRTGI